jgi:hypothetical protein
MIGAIVAELAKRNENYGCNLDQLEIETRIKLNIVIIPANNGSLWMPWGNEGFDWEAHKEKTIYSVMMRAVDEWVSEYNFFVSWGEIGELPKIKADMRTIRELSFKWANDERVKIIKDFIKGG